MNLGRQIYYIFILYNAYIYSNEENYLLSGKGVFQHR